MIAAFKRKGVSLQAIRPLLPAIREALDGRPTYLLWPDDGTLLFACHDAHDVLRFFLRAHRRACLIDVEYFTPQDPRLSASPTLTYLNAASLLSPKR